MFAFFWKWFGWDGSSGNAPGGLVCADVDLSPRVSATVTLAARVDAVAGLEEC